MYGYNHVHFAQATGGSAEGAHAAGLGMCPLLIIDATFITA